jgi:hypothetical protein
LVESRKLHVSATQYLALVIKLLKISRRFGHGAEKLTQAAANDSRDTVCIQTDPSIQWFKNIQKWLPVRGLV